MTAPKDRWLDREAGPVVRPYAVTKGRTLPAGGTFGLIDLVAASDLQPPHGARLSSEHRRILDRCPHPIAGVGLAADVDLPVGGVRGLLGALNAHRMIRILPTASGPVTRDSLLSD